MQSKDQTRRSFVKKAALGVGAVGVFSTASEAHPPIEYKLPREVSIASLTCHNIKAATSTDLVEQVIEKLESLWPLQPDILCLPELFPYMGQVKEKLNVTQQVEHSQWVIKRVSEIAAQNACYMICPVATTDGIKNYNSAVLINRKGELQGTYRKMHPAVDELEAGFSPGPADTPVFKTDFGMIGIQICFDIRWHDGWEKLQEKGVDVIFWPSAFPGGKLINARALQYQKIIVSSTLKDPARICDLSGNEIAKTGRWQKHWVCSTLNLEKVGLHAWPYVKKFDAIIKKYGRKIQIHYLHEEGHAILESRSPEIKVKDILKEFEIKTFYEHIQDADKQQKRI